MVTSLPTSAPPASGRVTTRAEDARGTPTQSHISPSILVYEEKPDAGRILCGSGPLRGLHPKPYTLHTPTPYTLHPAPHTLHPPTHTLHPTPHTYTLHPTPYTHHPTPYTLRPTPYTLILNPNRRSYFVSVGTFTGAARIIFSNIAFVRMLRFLKPLGRVQFLFPSKVI